MIALRRVAAILFGILAIVWPGATLAALVLLFGVYALVDGLLAIGHSLTNHAGSHRGWVFVEGLVDLIVAVVAFLWPGITALSLVYLIGAWAIVTGIMEIVSAIELRRLISGEWLLALGGIASVVFGVLVFLNPGAGALSILWLIGAYAIVFGVLMVALSLKVRNLGQSTPSHQALGS